MRDLMTQSFSRHRRGLYRPRAAAVVAPPAYLSHVVYRAKSSDWNGSNVVGENITLAPTGVAPSVVAGGLSLAEGMLSATVNFNLTGSTVILVATASASDNTRDSVLSLTGALGTLSLEAQTVGQAYGRLRSVAGHAFSSTLLLPTDGRNTSHTDVGSTVANVLSVEPTATLVMSGQYDRSYTASSNIVRNMTTLRIGRDGTTNYQPMVFKELIVLDTTDRSIVRSALEYVRSTYSGSDVPKLTPLMGTNVAITMDSIAAGSGATQVNSVPQGFADQLALRLGFAIPAVTPHQFMLAFAGAGFSTQGINSGTEPQRYAACGTQISTNTASLSGARAVIVFGGTNDWDHGPSNNGVPLGSLGDTTDATVYGAMRLTANQLLTNMDAGAEAFFCTPIARFDRSGNNNAGYSLTQVATAMRQTVEAVNSPRIKLIDTELAGVVISDFTTPDFIHPINSGHTKIADYIETALLSHYS